MNEHRLASDAPETLLDVAERQLRETYAAAWFALTASQRTRAVARLAAILLWKDGTGDVGAEEAASLTGLTVNRFYQIAAEWREAPSLGALAVFARGGTRRPRIERGVVERLELEARSARRLFPDASISTLAKLAVERAGFGPKVRLPADTSLRELVQRAVRDVDPSTPVGATIVFDCVATQLPRADERPHVAFFCLDRATGLILGVAAGTIERHLLGYGDAAEAALVALDAKRIRARYAPELGRAEFALGWTDDHFEDLGLRLDRPDDHHGRILVLRGDDVLGTYVKDLVGRRLSRIRFAPTRTLSGRAIVNNGDMTPWSVEEANEALRAAAEQHNADLGLETNGGVDAPARDLVELLGVLSGRMGPGSFHPREGR